MPKARKVSDTGTGLDKLPKRIESSDYDSPFDEHSPNEDSEGFYFRSVSKYPLLGGFEEEQKFFSQIHIDREEFIKNSLKTPSIISYILLKSNYYSNRQIPSKEGPRYFKSPNASKYAKETEESRKSLESIISRNSLESSDTSALILSLKPSEELIEEALNHASSLNGSITSQYEQGLLNKAKESYSRYLTGLNKAAESNLKLVAKIAFDFNFQKLPYMDLVSAGNEGLLKAIRKFDHTKEVNFSTYAVWWIKQSIRRELANHSRTIRVPVHINDRLYKYHKALESIGPDSKGRTPSDKKVADYLGWTLSQVRSIRLSSFPTKSLNSIVVGNSSSSNDDSELGDLIPDDSALSPSEEMDINIRKINVTKIISTLPEREKYILTRRFGLDGNKPESLERIGKKYNMTRERIRQLQEIALRKLRKRSILSQLY